MSSTVLITGASRGIGLALVREYVSRGWNVIATCRTPGKAKALDEILVKGQQLPAFTCDVSKDESIQECSKAVQAALTSKRIDVLINNAGISNPNHPEDPPSQMKRSEFLEIMNVNVAGVFTTVQAFMPLINEDAKIISISSSLGVIKDCNGINSVGYRCSKAALNMLSRCFALEYPKLTFVAVHPGWVQTDMGSAKNRSPPVSAPDSATCIANLIEDRINLAESGNLWSFDGTRFESF